MPKSLDEIFKKKDKKKVDKKGKEKRSLEEIFGVKKKIEEPPEETIETIIKADTIQKDKEKSLAEKAVGAISGYGKAVGSATLGAVQGIANMPNEVAGLATKLMGVKEKPKPLLSEFQNIKAENQTAQGLGRAAEQIAEFALPSSGATKVLTGAEKAINAIPKIGKLGKGALILASKMGIGAATTGGITALQGGSDKDIETSAKIGAAFPLAGEAIKQTGKLMQGVGKSIGTSVIRPNARDLQDGFDIKNVYKYDVGGSLNDTLTKTNSLMDDLGKQLKSKIGQSKESVNLNEVYKETAKKLGQKKAAQFGMTGKIGSALKSLKKEVMTQGNSGVVDLPTAQAVKRASGTMGAWKFGMQDPESMATEKVYNTFYSALKTQIEKKSPAGVKGINKQLSELIPIYNAAIRRLPVAERNNVLSLSDIVTLVGSSIDPKALGIALTNKLSKSGKVGNILVKKGNSLQKPSKIAPYIKGAIVKTVTGK